MHASTWKIFFCLLLGGTLAPSPLHAQFLGGTGEGFASSFAQNPDSCTFFFGGPHDGSDLAILANPDPCGYFFGDSTDGFASILLPNPDPCGYFFGDSTDGYASALRPNPDTCGFFEGTFSDGAASAFMASPVDCPTFYGRASDGFAVGEAFCLPLAVEGTELQGRMDGQNGYLWWYTYSEINNLGFILYRSQNTTTWEEIGFFEGQDNSSTTIKYEHRDEEMKQGINYYRWDQVDLDGSITPSNIVQLVWREDGLATSLVLYPVPLESGTPLHLDFQSIETNNITLSIIGISGQIVWQKSMEKPGKRLEMMLPTANLPLGTYVLLLDQGSHRSIKRFVVQ